MTLVTTFEKRKREKQLDYERKLLRDISLDEIKKSVKNHFNQIGVLQGFVHEGVEEACFDIAIESYLSGGEYSRFIQYGETLEMIQKRSEDDRAHFLDTLYNFWLYMDYEEGLIKESLTFNACKTFVEDWWLRGYEKGERRYKLRLH